MSWSPLRVRVPAKINLGLEVVGKRADGYHELVTLLQSIALWDEVGLEPAEESDIGLLVSPRRVDLGPPEQNLAVRAARLFARHAGRPAEGLRIRLRKSIPVGAGLGGGSADAAAVLFGLGLREGWDIERLLPLAAELGSDVPFFIRGGTQLGLGRGEQLRSLADLPPSWVLLVYPGVGQETREVYAGLNLALTRQGPLSSLARRSSREDPGPPAGSEQGLRGAGPGAHRETAQGVGPADDAGLIRRTRGAGERDLQSLDTQFLASLHNDLEPIVRRQRSDVSALLDEMKALGVSGARVTGSGSCLFALPSTRAEGRSWQTHFRARGLWAALVRTTTVGCHLVSRERDKNRRRSIGR